MIIVLFHVLYLLGKIVYRSYKCGCHPNSAMEPDDKECDDSVKGRSNLKRRLSDPHDEEERANIRFSPPAYIQRYTMVHDVLMAPRYGGKLHKVLHSQMCSAYFLPSTISIPKDFATSIPLHISLRELTNCVFFTSRVYRVASPMYFYTKTVKIN